MAKSKSKPRQYGQKPGSMHIDKRAESILASDAASGGGADDVLSTAETAVWLGVSKQFLEIGRVRGTGPAFVELGPNSIGYRRDAVRTWLRKRERMSTAARKLRGAS